jgi:hypothetical protein
MNDECGARRDGERLTADGFQATAYSLGLSGPGDKWERQAVADGGPGCAGA